MLAALTLYMYRSLLEWSSLVGDDSDRPLRMYYERESGEDVSSPKHGKVRRLRKYAKMGTCSFTWCAYAPGGP